MSSYSDEKIMELERQLTALNAKVSSLESMLTEANQRLTSECERLQQYITDTAKAIAYPLGY